MRALSILAVGGALLWGYVGCSVVNAPDDPVEPGPGGGDCQPPFVTLDNCGVCGHRCEPANVVDPSCADGTCGYGSCNVGFGDCDGDEGNGCETDTLSDVDHCGGCGKPCDVSALMNVEAATCVNGICGYSACAPGFDDCDNDPKNGCEYPVNTLAECGACGTPCEPDNVDMAVCTQGSCGYGSCLANFDDCDGDTANGCETDTSVSTTHCGACNVGCGAGEVCDMGQCRGALSCRDILLGDPNATDGTYTIDPDGVGGNPPIQIFCDMTTAGGGWTECLSFVNTAAEDIDCGVAAGQNYFHRCVDFTMASWSGNEVMVQLLQNNNPVYVGHGVRQSAWTYSNLTSPNGISSQYDRSNQHPNLVMLNTGHRLTISGFDAGSSGWGGSWGNGYVLVVDTSPCYACNVVVSMMGFRNTSPTYAPCQNRAFANMTAGHELMYSATGGVTTNSDTALNAAQQFMGELKFLVR